MNVGIVDAVQHQVHRSDTQHRYVEIKAVEHLAANEYPVLFK